MSIVSSNSNCYSNNVNISFFIRINILQTHLKMNFVFGTYTDKYKGKCVCVYTCKKVQITKSTFTKVFWIATKSCFSMAFWKKVCKQKSKSTGDNHAEDMQQIYWIRLMRKCDLLKSNLCMGFLHYRGNLLETASLG